jgi:O-antigen ligase
MARTLRHLAIPGFLFLCLLLGGSPQGIWRSFVLQAVAAAILLWALLGRRRTAPTAAGRYLLILAGCWFLLAGAQLIPLPPSWWTALPGRELAAEAFSLRGEPLPWLPLSLTPARTAETLPIMLVPLAVIAGMLLLGAFRSLWCCAALAGGLLVSVLLAAIQVTQGGPYLFPIHNNGASGLFANSNHQATFLLVSVPFLAVLIGGEQLGRRRSRKAKEGLGRIVIALGGLAVVLIGIALNGSLAALLLLVPVALASLAVALPKAERAARWMGGAALGLLLAGAGAVGIASEAGTSGASIASRTEIYQRTSAAIADSFPVGTGLGSFQAIYRQYEDPAEVNRFFVNHAHSDPLEWLLETGLAGGLLLLAFLFWWFARSWRLWRGESPDLMARAATIASAAVLAHSLVDYPLRDPAIQALFALCLAFMAEPRSHHQAKSGGDTNARAPRHLGLDSE